MNRKIVYQTDTSIKHVDYTIYQHNTINYLPGRYSETHGFENERQLSFSVVNVMITYFYFIYKY